MAAKAIHGQAKGLGGANMLAFLFVGLGRVDEFSAAELFGIPHFWDSSIESGMIHRSPTESEAGAHVDEDER